MATESPMRIMDTTPAKKWGSVKDSASFGSRNLVADELSLLLKGHKTHEEYHHRSMVPNRSGSAPPNMEGSFASFGNVASSGSGRLRSDSSDYVISTSDKGKKQMHYMGSNWKLKATGGGNSDGSLLLTRTSLSTHLEEPEDDILLQKNSEDLADNSPSIMSPQDISSLTGQHKNLVELIQADFSPTLSPAYNEAHSSSHVATNEAICSEIETLDLDNLSIKGKFLGKDGLLGSKDPMSHDGNTQETNSIQQQQLHHSHQHFHVQSNNMFSDSGKVLEVPPNFSLQTSGLTPPLYTSAASYMTSGNQYFPNPHSPLYGPQYSTGGYTFVPPFIPGYPPNTGLPMAFDPNSTQSLGSQPIVSLGETNAQAGELPLYNKFYGGHQGFVMQPPFPDPLQMPYFHYPSENSFSPRYGCVPPTNLPGDQFGTFAPQRDANLSAYIGDNKFPFPPNASLNIASPRKVGMPSNSFYGTTYLPHYPGSIGSPLTPGSPVGAENPFGRRYDPRFSQGFVRNSSVYPGWQGQRGPDIHIEPKKHSFLEELKANNARKINLSDIVDRIVEFSVDQHGSRFIQQKLENCSAEEKVAVFKQVLPHASRLMTDVFGNYVIQKFFEYGDSEQRKELANKLSGLMLPLSLQMYGCRVIQKALDVIELDQKTALVHELDGHVMRCVRDQNGNHVIQKCIECLPTENIGFIISAFKGHVSTLSTHPYGCRVIQRVLEHCSDDLQSQCIVDEILESSYVLAQDQYGNYVTQHVLERGKPHERNKIFSKLQGKIIQMSQHKYASNVVEKCLEYGDAIEREIMINEILEQPQENDNLLMMMKDQYANYVVQKILEISNDKQHDLLLKRIRGHVNALKKYTYGKHIVARFEQLCGEDEDSGTSEP